MTKIKNMTKIFHKLLMGASITLFSLSFGAFSINTEVDARLRGNINTGPGSVSSFYDTSKIKLGTTIDNVTVSLGLKHTGSNEDNVNFIAIDSFQLKIQDLFSGMLSMQLFNWDFQQQTATSSDYKLLSDITYTGAYFNIKPVDVFEFGFGYGISNFAVNSKKNTSHALKTDFVVGGPVPLSLVFGTTLNQGYTLNIVDTSKNTSPESLSRKFGVERMQLGVTIDLYKKWINAYTSVTLPIGSSVSYLASPDNLKIKKDIIYSIGIDGNIPVLDTGFAISYNFFYIGESFAKSLPNPLNDQITGLDNFAFTSNITPSFSLGLVKFSLGIDVYMKEIWPTVSSDVDNAPEADAVKKARDTLISNGVLGGFVKHGSSLKYDQITNYIKPLDKPKKPLGMGLEPVITLTFAPGISVDFLYKLTIDYLTDRPESMKKADMSHAIGMNVKAKFGYTAE